MAKIKTSELTGKALDYAVALCEGLSIGAALVSLTYQGESMSGPFTPSTNWAQGGPIIEREMRNYGFDLWAGANVQNGQFSATYCRGVPDSYIYGPTPLIAAMRCYVASKLGGGVEIPDELLKA